MSTFDPERYHAEGQDPADSGAGAWPPLDQPSELVQRLRNLRWPEASAQVRQRCWTELAQQMEARAQDAAADRVRRVEPVPPAGQCPSDSSRAKRGTDGQHDRRFGRHDFAARLGAGRHTGALGERIAATRGLATAARI